MGNEIYIGNHLLQEAELNVQYELVSLNGEQYNKISNVNAMDPFFMSVVSHSNHWMFIGSNGGLTAGRKDRDLALFPYYTHDKIINSTEQTGSKTLIKIFSSDRTFLWEPFSAKYKGIYKLKNNLYKSVLGNKIIFEEENVDLGLTFSYEWNFSSSYGFVRKAVIKNNTSADISIEVLDGIQNIVPFGVSSEMQNEKSNLVEAYKKNELINGLGVYALNAMIVDRAEPSEALKASTVWSAGVEASEILISSLQLDNFRLGKSVKTENLTKATHGAYFINASFQLDSNSEKDWLIVANVNQDHNAINQLLHQIDRGPELISDVLGDILEGELELKKMMSAADGFQLTSDPLIDARHYSNVLYNCMRGGIFDTNYSINREDFENYLKKANIGIYTNQRDKIAILKDQFELNDLKRLSEESDNKDFKRLCLEYLPLRFSRRHGDPSRPWNKFSINTHSEIDGSKILDYEGNWRDIFQNWEALAYSYPDFIEGMIHKFLNASTFDGYNPYRITKHGIDWEIVEPDDPWSYIGYWGDHQVIYLLKLLEFCEKYDPGTLSNLLTENIFVYANVPYVIKSYDDILKNAKDTIEFDDELHQKILDLRNKIGADAALLGAINNTTVHTNLMEKLLTVLLSKLVNFVPDAGIWMNTQRPEWNDANNALVGNGTSMVTLYYLRRFISFLGDLLNESPSNSYQLSIETFELFECLTETLNAFKNHLISKFDQKSRKSFMDALGFAGSAFRTSIYKNGFSGEHASLTKNELLELLELAQHYIDASITSNKRSDDLYHAYNLISITDEEVAVSHLDLMLEGQVAVLSAGMLRPSEVDVLLHQLKKSALFRKDQSSYMLYPNKDVKAFLEKNTLEIEKIESIDLLTALINDGNTDILFKDINGLLHFHWQFNNVHYLEEKLNNLPSKYSELLASDREKVLDLYENTFNHKAFTGRSGSFFGYEGLGSIYWHMNSKLVLAIQENCINTLSTSTDLSVQKSILKHYYEANEGLGVHKSPEVYGAFTTDPYSHTPYNKGAQQPGMTGQVKEDVINRFKELGIRVDDGILSFNPELLSIHSFLNKKSMYSHYDLKGQLHQFMLKKNELAFSYCQVPVIYSISEKNAIEVVIRNEQQFFEGLSLNNTVSKAVFNRSGAVSEIRVFIRKEQVAN